MDKLAFQGTMGDCEEIRIYSGSKKCPNVCMIWKDQLGVIC